jgi:Protein of unknown function (DUF2934)
MQKKFARYVAPAPLRPPQIHSESRYSKQNLGSSPAVVPGGAILFPRPKKELPEMPKAGTKKARTAQPPVPIDTAKPVTAKSANAVSAPQDTLEQIRRRAYELFEQRGRQDGFHEQDWLQAESEILSQRTSRTA